MKYNHLSKKAHKFLSPTDCKTARFYLLTKVHKPGNPGRPIISGNCSPTEHISLFVDSFLKPLVPRISSDIHDTPDFLRRILGIQHQVPSTAIIGTFDVSSLYTNIPHNKGIDACSKALAESGHTCTCTSPPITDIVTLMNHVLTKNNFTFLDKKYGSSLHGQTRGTHAGFPPHADLGFCGATCISKTYSSFGPVMKSLTRFIDHMNSFHRTIKFTSEYSTTETHFLDVVIRKEENGLTTDLFVKPTDKHQYLHSASCHPRHCKTSIAHSQALRLRWICSNDSDFCVTHRYSRSTLCPEVIVHGPFIKPSRKSSLCLGYMYPYFLRSPQPKTVPIRRFLLLSSIIPLYPP